MRPLRRNSAQQQAGNKSAVKKPALRRLSVLRREQYVYGTSRLGADSDRERLTQLNVCDLSLDRPTVNSRQLNSRHTVFMSSIL